MGTGGWEGEEKDAEESIWEVRMSISFGLLVSEGHHLLQEESRRSDCGVGVDCWEWRGKGGGRRREK